MRKLTLIFLILITLLGYSQDQESKPTFFSEIAEKVASEAYYDVVFGNPLEIVVM